MVEKPQGLKKYPPPLLSKKKENARHPKMTRIGENRVVSAAEAAEATSSGGRSRLRAAAPPR